MVGVQGGPFKGLGVKGVGGRWQGAGGRGAQKEGTGRRGREGSLCTYVMMAGNPVRVM